ncbi:MAG: chromosomal replication initiator protein DnaA [Alphaproteobacteria bacterium]|nr:chromosomal replication initiator protein DnaA [Alphaproteobacteria bacterium]
MSHAAEMTMDAVLSVAWERVSANLNQFYGDAIFRSWLKPMVYVSQEEGKLHLGVPTRFMREWINTHYMDEITRIWEQQPESEGYALTIDVTGAPAVISPMTMNIAEQAAERKEAQAAENAENDAQMGAQLDPRYTFENFVVGKPNELAFAAARRVAESAQVVQGCNPLFLYGGVGLGKTHLMHAIAWHIRRESPQRRVMYLSAEKFMYQFIRALRFKEALAFKEHFRSVDVLMIDDVQFIAGKDSTQEEFFHTFNALVDQNKQLIISGDRSPSDLEGIEERVRSRLGWGLVADIHATTYELRLGILQSKIDNLSGTQIPQKVVEFLAHKITSNVRELEGALNRVVAHSTLVGRPITLETTQEVLHDLLRANDRRLSIEDIQKQVAGHYNIKVSDMHSARRSRVVARPRQVAMYLAKKLTSKSLPEIGRKFGGKDHTTVMHAVKRVEELMGSDHEFAQDIELLSRMLQS